MLHTAREWNLRIRLKIDQNDTHALDSRMSSPRDDNEGGFPLDPQATKAFLAGNKALAKELGVKGREQSELMKAAHAEASKAIYKHRNPVSGGSLTIRRPVTSNN